MNLPPLPSQEKAFNHELSANTLTLNYEQVTDAELSTFTLRSAVRMVMVNDRQEVALLFSNKHQYYCLPGGGVDGSETLTEALRRECLEETGYEIEGEIELGQVREVRKAKQTINRSYGYLVRTTGVVRERRVDEEEDELVWLRVEEAIKLLSTSEDQSNLNKEYPRLRDKYFLEEALTNM